MWFHYLRAKPLIIIWSFNGTLFGQRYVQVDKRSRLDLLLSKKVKISVLKTKPNKKDQHYKLNSNTKEQFSKKGASNERSLGRQSAYFAKQHFGVELSNYASFDDDNIKPRGKVPSLKGKAIFLEEVIANLHLNLSMIIMV